MKQFLKEPLVHFLLIGALLFWIFSLTDGADGDHVIIIDQYDIQEVAAKWKLQWGREPTEDELSGLIDQYIREEVYYREGMAMNLDHNDEIIRRRIAQKMEFLSEGLAESSNPTDEVLYTYFTENIDRYLLSGKVDFKHVYFSDDVRKNPRQDAAQYIDEIKTDNISNFSGDSFPYEDSYMNADRSLLIKVFGTRFADSLLTINSTGLYGPVRSGFGYHIVNIIQVREAEKPEFDIVKSRVLTDYTYDLQESLNDKLYEELRSKYSIKIDNEAIN